MPKTEKHAKNDANLAGPGLQEIGMIRAMIADDGQPWQ